MIQMSFPCCVMFNSLIARMSKPSFSVEKTTETPNWQTLAINQSTEYFSRRVKARPN